jgi:hypothetical protein
MMRNINKKHRFRVADADGHGVFGSSDTKIAEGPKNSAPECTEPSSPAVRVDLTTLRQQFFFLENEINESRFFLGRIYMENTPNYGQINKSHTL